MTQGKRCLLASLFLAASSVFCLTYLLLEKRAPLQQARQELMGIEYLLPLRKLRELLPQHERRSQASLAGGEIEKEDLIRKQEEVDQVLRELDEIDRRLGFRLDTTEDLARIEKAWRQLKEGGAGSPGARALRDKLDTTILSLNTLVGDTSYLMLDPVLETYYLMDAMVVELVESEKLLRDMWRLGEALPADRALTAAETYQWVVLSAQLKSSLGDINGDYKVAAESDESLGPRIEPARRLFETKIGFVTRYVDMKLLGGGDIVPDQLFPLVDAAREAGFKLYDTTAPLLAGLLEQRLDEMESTRRSQLVLVLPLLVAGLGLSAWAIRGSAPAAKTSQPEVAEIERAKVRSLSAVSTEEALLHENQELKILVAELSLDNRSLRQRSAAG